MVNPISGRNLTARDRYAGFKDIHLPDITGFLAFDMYRIIAEIIAETYQGVSFTRVRWDLLYYAIISKSPEAGFGWEYVGI